MLLLIACLLTVMSAGAQETLDNLTVERLERDVTRELLVKDVGELANETAREKGATTVLALLRRLTIFARAGHSERALETLNLLAMASDLPPVSDRWVVAEAVKRIIGSEDLALLRVYYDRIMPTDAESAEKFLILWEAGGQAREIDSWLAARVKDNPAWLRWRIQRRVKIGTADELLNALAEEVKANPTDGERVTLYLRANNWANNLQNVSWLADVLKPDSAYEFYYLAEVISRDAPLIASKLLERSLALPFTERDMQLIRDRIISMYSMPPGARDWEKQLRFWTKRQLAEIYKATGQVQLAQVIIEDLVRMKNEDQSLEDVHQLAGAVQAQSGMRVVEAKILSDEAKQKESATYWIERAHYYIGRKEYEAVMDAYRSALTHVPRTEQGTIHTNGRLSLLREFAWFAASRHAPHEGKRDDWRAEARQVLLREFNAASTETDYAYWIAHIIIDDDLELHDLMDSLFIRQKDMPARLLAARDKWGQAEKWLIERIVCREGLTPAQKSNYWTQLETLARGGAPLRLFYLAASMMDCDESSRAVPLLVSYLSYVRGQRDESIYEDEEKTLDRLFHAYLGAGDWRAAEKLLLKRENLSSNEIIGGLLGTSLVAARVGAIDDAVRLWRTKANLDRRQLYGLDQLAATKAQDDLRQMYAQMKRRDPLSTVPDRALKILK